MSFQPGQVDKFQTAETRIGGTDTRMKTVGDKVQPTTNICTRVKSPINSSTLFDQVSTPTKCYQSNNDKHTDRRINFNIDETWNPT